VAADGTETLRRYVYDGEDILAILDENDTILQEFLHGPGIDEPLSLRQGNQIYSYHADALGSIIAITDRQGNIVQRYRYDAWGNITFTLERTGSNLYV